MRVLAPTCCLGSSLCRCFDCSPSRIRSFFWLIKDVVIVEISGNKCSILLIPLRALDI